MKIIANNFNGTRNGKDYSIKIVGGETIMTVEYHEYDEMLGKWYMERVAIGTMINKGRVEALTEALTKMEGYTGLRLVKADLRVEAA